MPWWHHCFHSYYRPCYPKSHSAASLSHLASGPWVVACASCHPPPPSPIKIHKHVRAHSHCHLYPGVWAKAWSRQPHENMSPHIHFLGGHFSKLILSKPEQWKQYKAVLHLSSTFSRDPFDLTLHQQQHAMKCTRNGIHLYDLSLKSKMMSLFQVDPTPQL